MKFETQQTKLGTFHQELYKKMDIYVHLIYKLSKKFPKEELYGTTSQLRRAALSVILNYIEGYARQHDKVHQNFLEISYGSLKESRYLTEFSYKRSYLSEKNYQELEKLAHRIGAMVWGIISKLK